MKAVREEDGKIAMRNERKVSLIGGKGREWGREKREGKGSHRGEWGTWRPLAPIKGK